MKSVNINKFVEKVAQQPSDNELYNMYFGDEGEPLRENLCNYLKEMVENKPTHLLLGEAAGPDGACRTGIPFTDEQILSLGHRTIGSQTIFTLNYNLPYITNGNIISENSAQRVWATITSTGNLPLMWNAVPYYPHKKDDYFEIRNPRDDSEVRKFKSFVIIYPTIEMQTNSMV
ncbi:MAG: hypothetical protein ACOYVD_08020 [Bacillota bacterium]